MRPRTEEIDDPVFMHASISKPLKSTSSNVALEVLKKHDILSKSRTIGSSQLFASQAKPNLNDSTKITAGYDDSSFMSNKAADAPMSNKSKSKILENSMQSIASMKQKSPTSRNCLKVNATADDSYAAAGESVEKRIKSN